MQGESSAAPARPPAVLPKPIKDALAKARVSWLKNTEVAQLLSCHRALGFEVSQEAPDRPQSGSVFLFNRRTLRFFRKDGHSWRKKADLKTVRETHEKLKVGSRDMLNCYYAHSDQDDGLQRRCYWLLDGDDGTVLVHYLASKKLGRANSEPRGQSEPVLPHFWDTARADDYERLPYSNRSQRTYQGGLQDTCMSFEQGPIITTAPDLDRACASSLLPPLPSSSSSRIRHPRGMLTMPSSSAAARQQYSTAMMGRPHAIASHPDAFMHRVDATPVTTRSPAMLGTTNGTTQTSHASHGAFRLGFREQPISYDRETMLTTPDSALSAGGSVLSSHESGLTGTAPALGKGYGDRQVVSDMQPEVLDESQRAVDAARATLLLSRNVMSQGNTSSAPSRIVESGPQPPASLESHTGLVSPYRRQPSSGGANQGYARSLPSGLDQYLAGLQQHTPQVGQSMEAAMQGLQHAALPGVGSLSEQELQQSVLAGQGLQQAALVQQGLNQTAFAGQNAGHSFNPVAPTRTAAAHHEPSPWDTLGPSPMIQDDPAFAHHPQTMTDHRLLQPQPAMPTGDMNQETLSTRSAYFSRDAESARGTLQWPLTMLDSSSCHAYSPWPVQPPAQPQSQPGLHTHSQMPAQASLESLQQPDLTAGFRSRSLPGLVEQSGHGNRQVWAHLGYATGFDSGLQTATQTATQTQAPLKPFADSFASHQARGQADALEYLRHSSLTPSLPHSWQSDWPANTQLPDLEARMEVEQQPMAQPDDGAAFVSWMQAQRPQGLDLHCTV